MNLTSFRKHFELLDDQRQSAKVTYPMFDIFFITLCAVIAGAEGWKEIKEYAEGHLDWFQKHGFLKSGVPVDDTIARVISRIKPEQFNQCFVKWMQSVNRLSKGEIIAIDGKTLRGSYDREDRLSTIHMINAFASKNKMVLGQLSTDVKSNEITAIPELLKLLEIKGAIVSIDAMGCQKEIAKTIIKQGADYLLAVKGNQPSLHEAVQSMFDDFRNAKADNLKIEKNRSRLEARACQILSAKRLAKEFPEWPSLKTVGVTMSYRQEKGKEPSLEYRYYICSTELTEDKFAEAVREHWAVENSLHWVLDLTMREDACQIYKDNGAENWGILRQTALNMLRKEKTKVSMPTKRRRAWMNTSFLEKVLTAGFSDAVKI
ncbi:ISAs1 family transposase [Parashewanella spongiae]|uniref:ISAs1 family transposase n=3 Tax=Parashewanella spongiae TaxID=342950 RepID=A0A3A6ST80_9GAMM|nr:ISAs1 family transposase [Parashewanella spongiae]RJY00351.1 ISAs1 family transposase [Parashewanella spongiae]